MYKGVCFTMMTFSGERALEFKTVSDFIYEIRTNDYIDTAISLDNNVKDVCVENAIIRTHEVHTVNDVYLFCRGIVYARAE